MQVEIWSDIVCPWCYIGKRRFEAALSRFSGRDRVEIIWRSFELDPSAPNQTNEDMATRLSKKYRMSKDKANETIANITNLAKAEGLEYHLDSAKQGNSFDAHRLLQLANIHGLGDAVKERLMRAYFTDSLEISNQDVLVELGVQAGLDGTEIRGMYANDYMVSNVRSDEALASKYGITGVPFFVFDSKYGVSGAQDSEVFLEVMNKVREEAPSIKMIGDTDAAGCNEDSCAL
ncbi:MAG: DsbA family oxidoreductase [Acidimicrobiaceae bacterium]|nr:DsbA family oxidoreductase [Acidimicrobiaceae bacterium]